MSSDKKFQEAEIEAEDEGIESAIDMSFSGHERNHLFANQGGVEFTDIAGVSGLDDDGDSRVFAVLDYDRDGWQDLGLVGANAPLLQLFRNQIGDQSPAEKGRFIALRFVGGNHESQPDDRWSNRDAYGASVDLLLEDGRKLYREFRCGDGFAAQNSATLVVGIGSCENVQSVTVRWPSGREGTFENVAAGTLVTAYENAAQSPSGEPFVTEAYRREIPPPERLVDKNVDGKSPRQLSWAKAVEGRIRVSTTTATWCAACRAELPQFAMLREAFLPAELELVGIPADPEDTEDKLNSYLEECKPAYRLDRSLPEEQLSELTALIVDEMGQNGLPATVVTDRRGTILQVSWGVPSISRIRELLVDQR